MELVRQPEGAPQEQQGGMESNPDVQAILSRFEEEFPGVETPPEMLQKYASTLMAQKPENKERFMELIVDHRRKMIEEEQGGGQQREGGAMMEGQQTSHVSPEEAQGGY